MIILDLYQIPDHSHTLNTTVLQLNKLKFYSTDCSLELLTTTYSIRISSNSDESKKLPDDGRPLPKHVG
jgi:hypothetical protein